MNNFPAGIRLALTAALELHQRWSEYWKVIQPWGWIYAALAVLDAYVYPAGNPSRLMTLLWVLLYVGLSLVMWWNWLTTLNRRPGQVSWDRGWDNQDFRQFLGSMLFMLLAIPFGLLIVIGLPVMLVATVLAASLPPAASLLQSLGLMCFVASLIYVLGRLLVLPPVLLSGQVPPLPIAWQMTARGWQLPVGALAVLFISNLTLVLLIAALHNLLAGLQVSRPGLWLVPLQLSIGFFVMGWLVLIGQRTYDYLRGGSHAGSRTE
jgi:hypothetical protein